MNLVFCSDNNYLPHLAAAIQSVLKHHSNEEIVFYIILNNCTEKETQIFCKALNADIRLIIDNGLNSKSLFISKHVSATTYQRIFLDQLLPKEVNKYLYLDCDLLITGSLEPLYNISLQDKTVAASPEYGENHLFSFPANPTYFNAGVLLVNRQLWQSNNITSRLEEYLTANGNNLRYWDQDALNSVLADSWLPVSPKWNMTVLYFRNRKLAAKNATCEEYQDIRIVHFNGSLKPWHFKLRHPYKTLYKKYLPKIYLDNFAYPDKTAPAVCRKLAAQLLVLCGLKKF